MLSLKDFNLSENLEQLIDLGITSFKIEGRLKDEDYVSNVVYYYRKKIDEIIAKRNDLEKASVGNVLADFIPDLEKTFNRGFTDYFFNQRNKDILAINSPKSIGKFVGIAKDIFKNSFILDSKEKISNGDGLCFLNKQGDLTGSNVNKVEGSKIFLNEMNGLISGAKIYRNFDIQFNKQIKSGAPKRRIPVVLSFLEIDNGFSLIAEDGEGNKVSLDFPTEKQEAQNKAAVENTIISQLSKTGETIFSIQEIKILWKNQYFFKISLLNEMRRNILKMLLEERIKNYKVEQFELKESQVPFIAKELNYESNVANKLARMFYEKHGVLKIEPAFELIKERQGKKVMTTKHCLKHYFGYCTKTGKTVELKEPLYLVNEKGQKFLLKFDCAKCQMEVLLPK